MNSDQANGRGAYHVLSMAVIEDLERRGFNQSQIARMLGVSRQAVSEYRQRYGGAKSPRQLALEAWPWQVPAAMCQSIQYRSLRDHGEYMATGGKGMSEAKFKRLRTLYRKVHAGYVVEFDPEIPPGETKSGGWAYRERTPEDGDLIIRVNEHTNLTEDGRRIWRLPIREP